MPKHTVQPSVLPLAMFAIILAGCGSSVYYVRPPDWSEQAKRDSAIAAFAPALRNVNVFIDPGHGGEDRSGVGPEGDVVEADLNLGVALRLREYLKQAGANVIMSRESDITVPLDSRAQQANVNKADIFVSVHHNAADNPYTNYTSTFYHARPGSMNYTPSSQDLARYIQRDLAYVMGNPSPLASFDGTMSDMSIHPGKGFAVLREARMTAVLVECGFFTSPYEEQRLKLPEFNDIEAWGIFRGIGKYLKAGIPAIAYAAPTVFSETRPKIGIRVIDKADIDDESIRIFIDGKEEGFSFNRKTGQITTMPSDDLPPGYHHLAAQVRNANGNSSAPFELYFAIGRSLALLRSTADPLVLPPDESAFSMITVSPLDSSGAVLPDGLPVRFRTSAGIDTILTTRNGLARAYVYPGAGDKVTFEASNGPVKTSGSIAVSPAALYTRGLVMSSDGSPVTGATVTMPGGGIATTNETGEYIITGSNTSGIEVLITAHGYFGKREALTDQRVQDPVILAPVARGALHGKTFALDLVSSSAMDNPSRLDVRAMNNLADLLTASGAEVILLGGIKTRKEKADLLAARKHSALLQMGLQAGVSKISIRVNGISSSKALGESLLRAFPEYTGVGLQQFVLRMTPKEEFEKARQAAVMLPSPGARSYEDRLLPLFSWNAAWAVYAALLSTEGYKTKGAKMVEIRVQDKGTRAPAPFILIELNHALKAMSDPKGLCRFRAVTIPDDDVRILGSDLHEVGGVKTDIIN